jgi:orotidine-5'-phosphate decarboxylase
MQMFPVKHPSASDSAARKYLRTAGVDFVMKNFTEGGRAHGTDAVLVALDVPSGAQAVELAQRLEGRVGGFKVGMELFYSEGQGIVEQIGAGRVFLDLKLHDIPNTVAGASRALAKMGVAMFNFHCLGGAEMMRAGADAARSVDARCKLLGVTILTSHDRRSLAALGLDEEPRDAVRRLAMSAREAGLDGVVCSPQEIELVRQECGDDFLIVTPGIRPVHAELGDQKRVLSPSAALQAGANFLVVGRPITQASDPAQAASDLFAG